MKKNIAYAFLIAIALFLGHSAYALELDGQPAEQQGTENSKDLEEEFSAFLTDFTYDESFQRESIKYPLMIQGLDVDVATAEVTIYIQHLCREQIKFPVMPSFQELIEESFEFHIVDMTEHTARVDLVVDPPDTDYNISYFFGKNGRWRLERIEDWSVKVNITLELDGQPAAQQSSANPKDSSPAEDFSAFLRKFVDDEAFQRESIQYPLIIEELDADSISSGMKVYIEHQRREQVRFPVMPSRKERAEVPLEIEIINVTGNNAKILLGKPDTGYNIYYFFKKNDTNGRWELYWIKNWSL